MKERHHQHILLGVTVHEQEWSPKVRLLMREITTIPSGLVPLQNTADAIVEETDIVAVQDLGLI